MEKTLFILFISIFAVTAVITLLGITGVIKTIKDKYLNALFTALILEVVAAVFILFNNYDFSDSKVDLNGIISSAGIDPPTDASLSKGFIVDGLKKSLQVDSLKSSLRTLTEELNLSKKEIENLENLKATEGQGFYGSINFLHQKINEYKRTGNGRSINITHDVESKQKVFEKILSILSDLGFVREGDGTTDLTGVIDKYAVRKKYESFKRRYTLEEENLRFIEEYDLTQMIRSKLRSEE